jgi:hypothetical protein
MINKGSIVQRIDQLLHLTPDKGEDGTFGKSASEVFMGTLNLAVVLYGDNRSQVMEITQAKIRIMGMRAAIDLRNLHLIQEMKGMLTCFNAEIEAGLISSLVKEARGEILADFVSFSKEALNDGHKDVGAVLACAALEDCLKRYAESEGLSVDGKSMSEVISALKSAGKVRGPQGSLLQSFQTIRNKAFHAQWDKIGSEEIQGVIAFTQEFLVQKFS